MVAQQTLDLFVGVRILPGELSILGCSEEVFQAGSLCGPADSEGDIVAFRRAGNRAVKETISQRSFLSRGPFVYRLGQKILNL